MPANNIFSLVSGKYNIFQSNWTDTDLTLLSLLKLLGLQKKKKKKLYMVKKIFSLLQ